ncbi:MAG: MFS transporter [Azoarcus sp.]|jgi:MFS family permease|nr:MFS transporter [Azoarcus sp.]
MNVPLKRPAFGWIVLLACFAGLGIGIARVATSLYSIALQASEFQLGVIAAAQSVGILFTSLPVGILVQRHGPLLPLCIGSLSCGLLYAATPAVPSIWFLVLCTTLVSVVMPMRFISLNTVFLQQTKAVGAARAGWFRGAHMTGFLLIGPPLGVLLLERFGFGGAFLAIASTFLATFFVAFRAVGRHSPDAANDGKRPVLGWKEIGAQLRLLRVTPDLGRTSLYEFFTQSVSSFFGFFIVVIALQNYRFSSHEAAMLLTFEGGTFVAALFLTGMLLNRWGRKRFYQASFLLLASSLLLLVPQKGALLLWAASALLGAGLGMVYIGNFMAYARIGETLGMGRISGLSGLIGPMGGFAGSLLGGWLGGLWGLQTLFLPMGLVCLLFFWQVCRSAAGNGVRRAADANAQAREPSVISSFEEGAT